MAEQRSFATALKSGYLSASPERSERTKSELGSPFLRPLREEYRAYMQPARPKRLEPNLTVRLLRDTER